MFIKNSLKKLLKLIYKDSLYKGINKKPPNKYNKLDNNKKPPNKYNKLDNKERVTIFIFILLNKLSRKKPSN